MNLGKRITFSVRRGERQCSVRLGRLSIGTVETVRVSRGPLRNVNLCRVRGICYAFVCLICSDISCEVRPKQAKTIIGMNTYRISCFPAENTLWELIVLQTPPASVVLLYYSYMSASYGNTKPCPIRWRISRFATSTNWLSLVFTLISVAFSLSRVLHFSNYYFVNNIKCWPVSNGFV